MIWKQWTKQIMIGLLGTGAAIVITALAVLVVLAVGGFESTPVAAGAAPAALPPQQPAQNGPARTMTVVGEGLITLEPDLARINIGVQVVGERVKEATEEAATTLDAVLAALRAQGIAEKDIQTSGYNVWAERPYGPDSFGATDQVRYNVNNSVTVVVRDLEKVGAVLDAALEAGANSINGVTFSVADSDPYISEARAEAVANGQARAEELATLNGVQLGEVISVSEVIGNDGVFQNSVIRLSSASLGFGGGGGPIQPGELELSVQLQITYAIE